MITFREYTPADEFVLIDLFNTFQDYFVGIDPLKRVRRLPEYGQVYLKKVLQENAEKKGRFILAEIDHHIVGFVVGVVTVRKGDDLLEGIPSTYGTVTELFVDENYRTQKIGSELIKKIEDYFREKNCDAVMIEVFAPNINARAFYAHHGYGERDIHLLKLIT